MTVGTTTNQSPAGRPFAGAGRDQQLRSPRVGSTAATPPLSVMPGPEKMSTRKISATVNEPSSGSEMNEPIRAPRPT